LNVTYKKLIIIEKILPFLLLQN